MLEVLAVLMTGNEVVVEVVVDVDVEVVSSGGRVMGGGSVTRGGRVMGCGSHSPGTHSPSPSQVASHCEGYSSPSQHTGPPVGTHAHGSGVPQPLFLSPSSLSLFLPPDDTTDDTRIRWAA